MRARDYVPESVIDYCRLIQLKRKYPLCSLHSSRIGDNVVLGRNCMISRNVEITNGVEIGDHSYVNAGTYIASGRVGKFCSVGYNCQIGMPEHPTGFLSTSPQTYGRRNIFGTPSIWNDFSGPPDIGSDVWIGSQALVMQHVSIGHGAIVAGGAVVTRHVEPYTIVAGVPAKPLRKRFDEDTIAALLELKWWDLSDAGLQQLADVFQMGSSGAARAVELLKSGRLKGSE